MREEIAQAIAKLTIDGPQGSKSSLREKAQDFFGTLGYSSDRTLDLTSVDEFQKLLEYQKPLTEKQRQLFNFWKTVEIVFQITDEEIKQNAALGETVSFDNKRIQSFLFLSIDLNNNFYSRTYLAETTRVVNRGLLMPAIILFRHGPTFTISVIHRRPDKRDSSRDVLEQVTLIKDIRIDKPHRAHIDILSDLALPNLIDEGIQSFDELHIAWEQKLDIEELNRRFYVELFTWFEQATEQCQFPDDGAGEGNLERHVIRLITRLLFIWFLKEKRLVPDKLFTEEFAKKTLKHYDPEQTNYYCAVLQNLFFATLNTEINKRGFRNRRTNILQASNKYHYQNLLASPETFLNELKSVPFVNGGLFDCLDNTIDTKGDSRRIDAFTDELEIEGLELEVPANLFLNQDDGLFPLFRRYKFTVEENTPLEQEIALDPELLGRVFENLLAAYNPETRETARKQTGSYYTPRHIVDYMVREALVAALAPKSCLISDDLESWCIKLHDLLNPQKAFDNVSNHFNSKERKTIVRAISELRVLDPAVGSGAYPVSALHKLTLALKRLDPDNQCWEELQREKIYEKANARSDIAYSEELNEELSEIEKIFGTYRDSDFGRKLYLIQNTIFGIDIQPIACQIAKLRFFISLVIEQKTNYDLNDNLGIRPLPNLETRFVIADTLLGLGNNQGNRQKTLIGDEANAIHGELFKTRMRYFHATSSKTKIECRKKDKELRNRLEELDHLNGQISSWDPYDQNSKADWFDPEYMFGVPNFDIVIGNPPYIPLPRNQGELRLRYKDVGFRTFCATGDVYQLFYEKGCKLLKPKSGILCYITSNSWLCADYGKQLRYYFSTEHTPLRLLQIGKDIFENAIVDTNILFLQSDKSDTVCKGIDISTKNFQPEDNQWLEVRMKGDKSWMILSSIEQTIMDKIEAKGTPLKEWDISIYYGIKTGFNDAFIIDNETKEELIRKNPRSKKLLKPILRGRDIQKYRANWVGLWLIDVHNGYGDIPPINIHDYPSVKQHLDKFYGCLAKRHDRGITPYNLRNCAYHEEFSKEKLIWIHLVRPRYDFHIWKKTVYCI